MRSFIKSHRRNSSDRDPGQYSDGNSTSSTAPTFPSTLTSSPLLTQKPAFPDAIPLSPGKKSRNRLKKFLKQKVSTSNLAGLAASQHPSPVSPTSLTYNQTYSKPEIPGSNRPSQENIRKQQITKPLSSTNLPYSTVSSPTIFGTKTHEWGTSTNNSNTSPILDNVSSFSQLTIPPLPPPPPRKVLRFQNPSTTSANSNRSQSSLGRYQLVNESLSSLMSTNDLDPVRSHLHELDQIESGGSSDDFSIVVIKKNATVPDSSVSSSLKNNVDGPTKNSHYHKDQKNNFTSNISETQNTNNVDNDENNSEEGDGGDVEEGVDDVQSNSSSKSSKFSFVGRNTSMKYYKSDAQIQREEAVLKQKKSDEHFNAFINDVESMQELQDDMNYIDFDEKDETDDLFNRKLFSISDEEEEEKDKNVDSGSNYINFSDDDDNGNGNNIDGGTSISNGKEHIYSTENSHIETNSQDNDIDDDNDNDDLDNYLDEINEDDDEGDYDDGYDDEYDDEYEDDFDDPDLDNYENTSNQKECVDDDFDKEKQSTGEILFPGGDFQFSQSDQDITTDNISPGLLPVNTSNTEVDEMGLKSSSSKDQDFTPVKKVETPSSVSNDIHSLLARLANAHTNLPTSRTSTFDSNITIKPDSGEQTLNKPSDITSLGGLGIQKNLKATNSTSTLQEVTPDRVNSISRSQKVVLNGLSSLHQDSSDNHSSVMGRFHRANSIKYHQLEAKNENDDLSFLNKRYSWLPNDDSETRLNIKSKTKNYGTLYEDEDENVTKANHNGNPKINNINKNENGEYDYDIYGSYTETENSFDDSMLEEINRIPEDYDSDEWLKGQLPTSTVFKHSNLSSSTNREKTKIKKTNMKSYTEHKNIGLASVTPSNTNFNNTIKLDEKTITLFRPIRNSSTKSQQSSNDGDFNNSSSASIDSHNYLPRPKSKKSFNNHNQLNFDIGGSEDLSNYEDEGEDDFQEGGLYYITPNNSRINGGARKDSSPLTTISEASFDSNVSRSPFLG